MRGRRARARARVRLAHPYSHPKSAREKSARGYIITSDRKEGHPPCSLILLSERGTPGPPSRIYTLRVKFRACVRNREGGDDDEDDDGDDDDEDDDEKHGGGR